VPLLLLLVLLILGVVALIPISIVQRYRVGTSRQRARGWLAAINLIGLTLSTGMFLAGAAITSVWVPTALTYTAAGLLTGIILGIIGLSLTRWEPTVQALHYTPNRWLVLTITVVVTARIAYGFWRAWQSWSAGMTGGSWYVAAGVDKTMAAGGVVLGYYLAYWLGVRRRLMRHLARPIRRM
jgi:hypothetical protein